jgi:glutamate-1-semialdehyde 2,1-aminomutase
MDNEFAEIKFDKSDALFEKAKRVTPYGTHSAARLAALVGRMEGRPELPELRYPRFMQRAKGSHIYDVDGNDYIDYNMALGPVILGHANPIVNDAVRKQLDNGLIFGTCHELEIEVSEKITRHVPCAEMFTMCSSGSDATLGALRIARAYTKKEKVVRFDGHYHSWHDWQRYESIPSGHLGYFGIPRSVEEDYIPLPWNESRALKTLKTRGHEIAAVICEPVIGNLACITPVEGYLEELREICTQHGILLIFDEVVTALRLGLGGAQTKLGITPDLCTFGKCLANGLPIGGIGGKREFMLSANKALLGGTFNSNPVSCAASLATLTELEKESAYTKMRNTGKALIKGFQDAAQDIKIQATVQGYDLLFSVVFTEKDKIRYPRELATNPLFPHAKRAAVFWQELVRRGVYNVPTRASRWCLSTAHEKEDIDRTIQAVGAAFKEAKQIT